MAQDPGKQLSIHQQINKLLKERQVLLLEQVDLLGAQAKMAKEVCNGLDCKNLEGMEQRLNSVNDSLKKTRTHTEELNEGLAETAEAAEEARGKFIYIQKAAKMGAVAGFIGGVKSGFGGMLATIKNVFGAITNVIGAIGRIGMSIISLPFKIFRNLIGLAQQNAGAGNALREAMEEVRKEFGDISTNEGKSIIGSMKTLHSTMAPLAKSGASVGRIFGYGFEGMANFLKEVNELATAAGAGFGLFQKEVEKNGAALIIYKKGLGLTAEQMANFSANAVAGGSTATQAMNDFANAAINAGDAHGISSKVIGKAMGEMTASFEHFGGLAPEVMANVAVFTHKLGIEVKALQGQIDKFDNFEDAAKSAARLNSVFGIQIDAMKMMREQDPAKRLQMQRDAYKKAGVSIEKMTRQQQNLFASSVGMSRQDAIRAFSAKNMGKSYEELNKKTADNKKKTLTQAEALQKLSKNIERLIKTGQRQFTGFLDAFLKGFGKGILRSKEMRKLFRNINRSLNLVFRSGKRVGKMFVSLFPGIKDVLGALAELFSPKRMRGLMKNVESAFKDLFMKLRSDPNAGFETFMEAISEAFGDYFSESGHIATKIIEGAKSMLRAIGGLMGQMIMYILPKITEGLNELANYIRNPTDLGISLENASGFMQFFAPIVDALIATAPALGSALIEVIQAMFEKAKPHAEKALKVFLGYLFGKFMLTVVGSMIKGALAGTMSALVGGGIGKLMGGAMLGGGGGGPPPMPRGAGKGAMESMIDGLARIDKGNIGKAAINLALMALALIPALVIFAGTLVGLSYILAKADMQGLAVGIPMMGGMLIAMAVVAAAAAGLSFVPVPQLIAGTVAIAAIGVVLVALAALAASQLGPESALSKVDLKTASTFGIVMVTLIGASVAVGMAAAALGFVATAFGGAGAILIAAGLAVLTGIAIGVLKFTEKAVVSFDKFTETQLKKAELGASAAMHTVRAVAKAASTALIMGGGAGLFGSIKKAIFGGESPIEKGLRAMKKLAGIMATEFPAIIKGMREASGDDPRKVKNSVEAIQKILEAMRPMMEMAKSFGDFAAGISRNYNKNKHSIENPKLKDELGHMTGAISVVITQASSFIKGMVRLVGGLKRSEVSKVKAVGPLLSSISKIFSTVTSPVTAIIQAAHETRSKQVTDQKKIYRTYNRYHRGKVVGQIHSQRGLERTTRTVQEIVLDTEKAKEMFNALENAIPGYFTSLTGGIKQTINAMKGIVLTKEEVRNIENLNKFVGPLINSLQAMVDLIMTFAEMPKKLGLDAGNFKNAIGKLDDLNKFMFGGKVHDKLMYSKEKGGHTVPGFETESGIMPVLVGIVKSLIASIAGISEAVPESLLAKGGMGPLRRLVQAFDMIKTVLSSVSDIINKGLSKQMMDAYTEGGAAGLKKFRRGVTSTFKSFTKLFKSKSLRGLLNAAGGLTFKEGLPKDQDFIDSRTKLTISLENIGIIGDMVKKIDSIGVNLAKIKTFYTAITDIKNIVEEAGNVKEIKPFLGGGGTIVVQHRHQNLSIDNITVNINAKQLAAEIMKAPKQTTGTFKGKRVATRPAE